MPDPTTTSNSPSLAHIKGPACMLSAIGGVVDYSAEWKIMRSNGRRATWPATLLDLEGYDPATIDTAWNRVVDGHTAVITSSVTDSEMLVLTPVPQTQHRHGVAVVMATIVTQPRSTLRVRRQTGDDSAVASSSRLRPARRLNDTSLCSDDSSIGWLEQPPGRAPSATTDTPVTPAPSATVDSDMLMARMLVHDMNNLFGGILGNADLAMHLIECKEDASECIRWIKEISEQAVGITQQLDFFAKPGPVNVERIDMAKTLQFLVDQTVRNGPEPVRSDIAADLWTCNGDYSQIYQALQHVLQNALLASPGQPVRVEAHNQRLGPTDGMPNGDYVVIKIVDRGEGVPDALKDRIFEPGFSMRYGGRGQGLAIARTVVEGHRGGIRYERENSERSVMRLALPAASGPSIRKAAISPDTQPRILVLDSREIVRYTFTRMGSMLGYRIEPAVSRNEVERLLREGVIAGRPHSILLIDNRWFGEGNRCEALEEIRDAYPGLRVVLMEEPKSTPRDYGSVVDTTIPKPISLVVLRELIERMSPAPASE